MDQKEMNALFADKHKEYSIVAQYPPFTTSFKKRTEFLDDMLKEEDRIMTKLRAGDEDAVDRMFSTVEAKWADDLEEARLYQKRYPQDQKKAQQVVLKMEGKEIGDDDVPLVFSD